MEELLVILALKKILGITKFRINKADLDATFKIDSQIDKMVKDFLAGEVTPVSGELLTLDEARDIKEKLRDLNSDKVLQDIIVELNRVDAPLNVTAEVAQLVQYLQQKLPTNDTLEGGLIASRAPAASISDDVRFLWVLRLIDNPFHILTLMQTQQLTRFDTEVVALIFPGFHTKVTDSLIENVLEEFNAEKHVPRTIKTMLSIFLQLPIVNAKTVLAYGQSDVEESDKKPENSPDIAAIETEIG